MKRSIRLALLSLCVLSLLFAVASQGIKTTSAMRARAEARQSAFVMLKSNGDWQQQGVDAKKGARAPAPIVVREVDVSGLKKLLALDEKSPGPLLVNFWATWCEPCRAEFPDLVKIDEDYRTRGLKLIAVSIDDVSEINSTVPKFLEEMRATMPVYLLNTLEPEAAITYVDPQWSGSLPATFLYDAQGKLVFKHIGRIKPLELRAAIKTVISDK